MRDMADGQPEVRAMLDPAVTSPAPGRRWAFVSRASAPPLGHRHLERSRGVRFLRRQIDEHSPAAVLAATDNMGLIAALARRGGAGEPLFAMKLTNALLRPGSGALKAFYRRKLFDFIFNRLDLVLTLSDAEERQLSGLYPGRAPIFQTVANPYISDDMLGAGACARGSTSPRLVTAGRMVEQKRFDLLLRAFASIDRNDARLTILGDGPLRRSLEDLARSLGIADRVEMPGYTGDVVKRLRQSDLFVLSSDYEGLPAVILEALASGCPVVTTDSFLAAGELLDGVRGCAVVPVRDPAALAGAIERMLRVEPDADDLRKLAFPYRIDAAVGAHIKALDRAMRGASGGAA